jgi:methylenetetrahydrofolate reductase (NADPH)
VTAMNSGKYLDELIDAEPTNFCIGVSAYPEKHFESPNLAYDIDLLWNKQQAGAHYAVSQMFFDNSHYYRYVELARERGITLPIIPGLKILTAKSQLTKLPSAFYLELPQELVEQVLAAPTDKEVQAIGIEWAYRQSLDLLEKGTPILHYYIMQNTAPFLLLMEKLKKHL